ncbi:MAG TPA: ABC transporter ATP-binding protein [Candidatus Acidoferrales bacterium]|jgi:ABC-2 type transport system ATP-binding protein|nr:ABC transporter ATP-binding protein [Candidatus Acidoferrales bacterium]
MTETILNSTDNSAVRTENLRKVYGKKVAVRGLSLEVARGTIFGFLGPNGAGKSTSIKMLLGLVRPTDGRAYVLGAPSTEVEVRRKIGFLPEDFRFYEWLTPGELLHFHGRLCGVPASVLRQRVPKLLELVGLTPHQDKRLAEFSKGMLQRAGLAQALVHEPELIFLDEPTSGLDPMGRRLVRDVIRAQRERGATVFLNSHLLSEVEITCDEVAFIKDGEVIAKRDLRESPQGEIRVVVRGRQFSVAMMAGLKKWITSAQIDGELLTLTTHSTEVLPDVLRHIVAGGAEVFEFRPERLSLEDLFVRIMGEDRGL